MTGSPLGAQTDDERSDTEDTEFALEPDEDPDEEDYWQLWDAQLQFSGRQFVEVDVEQTDFVNDPTRESQEDVGIDQRLQVEAEGTMAQDRMQLHINYDDALPEVEQQQMLLRYRTFEHDLGLGVYQGGIEAGDVQLDFPNNRFVSFDKEVFGLAGQMGFSEIDLPLGLQGLEFHGVGSMEKGETQRRVFTGQNERQIPDPTLDINPLRRTYYLPLAHRDNGQDFSVAVGSETVLLDDQNRDTNDGNTRTDLEVCNDQHGGMDEICYTGDFNELVEGEDYTIDYERGVIRFRRTIRSEFVLAVELESADGTEVYPQGSPLLIKDQDESDEFDLYHLLNYYSLGTGDIVRDDTDRLIEIRDDQGEVRPDTGTPTYAQLLGLDPDGNGSINEQFIDFERGVLRVPRLDETQTPADHFGDEVFVSESLSNAGANTNPTVYQAPSERESLYEIHQEIMVERNVYSLGFQIVRESERIFVDGNRVERGVDYTIDYQSGFITFFDHVNIDEDSRIEVDYEQQGLGLEEEDTFLGGHFQADFLGSLGGGFTMLTNQEGEPDRIPTVGDEAQSLAVDEFQMSWNPMEDMEGLVGGFVPGESPLTDYLDVELEGAWANSDRNPNIQGQAAIDSMNQSERRETISSNWQSWSPADPIQLFPGDRDVLEHRGRVEFEEEEGEGFDPDPPEGVVQESVRVRMPFSDQTSGNADTFASFQQLFASSAPDLRGYQYLEFWIRWESPRPDTVSVDLGQVTENTDRSPNLLTEDQSGDGFLNPGEDVGYETFDFTFGADNSQLDSEDLRGNDRLNERERYLHVKDISQFERQTTAEGWSQYRVPIRDADPDSFALKGDVNRFGFEPDPNNCNGTPQTSCDGLEGSTDAPSLSDVLRHAQMIRFNVETESGGSDVEFLMDRLGVARTSWQTPVEGEHFRLETVSEIDDPRLPAPGTSEFREDEELSRGINMLFQDPPGSDTDSLQAFLTRPSGEDLGPYQHVDLLLNVDEFTPAEWQDPALYLRLGSSREDYIEYRLDLTDVDGDDWITNPGQGWRRLRLDLATFRNDILNAQAIDQYVSPDGNRRVRGDPNLRDVTRYEVRLHLEDGPPGEQSILMSNLVLDGPQNEQGEAEEWAADVSFMDGLIQTRHVEREVDGEFRSVGVVNSATANDFVPENEVHESTVVRMPLDRLFGFGLINNWTVQYEREESSTEIPGDRVERIMDDDLGSIERSSEVISSTLSFQPNLPDLRFSWFDNDRSVDQTRNRNRRFDDRRRDWTLQSTYSEEFESFFGLFSFGDGLQVTTDVRYSEELEQVDSELGQVRERDRDDTRRRAEITFRYRPVEWLEIIPGFLYRDRHRSSRNRDGIVDRRNEFQLGIRPDAFAGFSPTFQFEGSSEEGFSTDLEVLKDTRLITDSALNIGMDPEIWWSALDFMSLSYRFSSSGNAQYTGLNQGVSVTDLMDDFYGNYGSMVRGTNFAVEEGGLGLNRNRGLQDVQHSLDSTLWGPWGLRSRFRINLQDRTTQSDNSFTETQTDSYRLSNRLNLNQFSRLFSNYSRSSSLNLGLQYREREERPVLEDSYQVSLDLTSQWAQRFHTGFSAGRNWSDLTDRAVTEDSVLDRFSFDISWVATESESDQWLWFAGRLELDGSVGFEEETRERDGETRLDEEAWTGEIGASYDVSENLRARLNGGFNFRTDSHQAAQNRETVSIRSSVDYRF